jgi:hypothetical protein
MYDYDRFLIRNRILLGKNLSIRLSPCYALHGMSYIATSHDLTKWHGHHPKNWTEFKNRYFKELGGKDDRVQLILKKVREEKVTFLFGAKEEKFNNAVSLNAYIETKAKEVKK